MPLARKKGDSFKACDEAMVALTELGGPTVENIQKLDYKLRSKCFAAFRDARKEDEVLKEQSR